MNLQMITSLRNDKVKYVRKLQDQARIRAREQRFVLEGVRLVEEVVQVGLPPTFVFYTEALKEDRRGGDLVASLRAMGAPCYAVSEAVMESCSDTVTPQGVLVVLPLPNLPRPANPDFTLIIDRLRDPGNLGTILRTALSAGVEQVFLAPGTVDATNPKVVRAAMGAHLRLPVVDAEWNVIGEVVRGCDVWLAAAGAEIEYTAVDWTRPAALIIGSEAHGAGERARSLAQSRITIPMASEIESLNAAIATAIILFEAVRQRRVKR